MDYDTDYDFTKGGYIIIIDGNVMSPQDVIK